MEAHHGENQIMSEEGVGTIVDVLMPIGNESKIGKKERSSIIVGS